MVVSPWPPARLVQHSACNPDAAPVEVAVIIELRAPGCEQLKQPPACGRGLAADADQRLAPGSQFIGGGGDHHRVLAYAYPADAQWFVMAAELAEREHRRLSCLPVRRQRPAQSRARVAGQAEAEHQR